jgi:hypothetical protein
MYENVCGWGIVDICMTFHKRAFDFFIPLHIDLTLSKLRAYELSKKCQHCQLYPTHRVDRYIFVHGCHTYPQSL